MGTSAPGTAGRAGSERRRISPSLGLALVMIPSAVGLVVELVAVRLVAPYVGLTLETYSAAIGVALAGISAGAYIGGNLADRFAPERLLPPALVLAAVLVWLARPVATTLGPELTGQGAAGALFLVSCSALLPMIALSTVPPVVIKAALADLDHSGSIVGRYSAAGTLGALTGTFLTGFVLLGAFSSRDILIGAGAVLAVLAAAVLRTVSIGGRGLGLALLIVPAAAAALAADGDCDRETKYYCVRITEEGEELSLFLDDLRHSAIATDDPKRLISKYAQRIGDVLAVAAPAGRPLKVLFIGGGGFALPRHVLASRPGSRVTVLEIDPAVYDISRRRLGLRASPSLRVRFGDARTAIAEEGRGTYDAVVGDAFGARSVPWHLTTREFVMQVRRVLRPGGVYAMNIVDGRGLDFLRAELRTLRSGFAHVALSGEPRLIETRTPGANWVTIASARPIELVRIRALARPRGQTVLDEAATASLAGVGEVLSDNHAPVDQLLSRVALGS